VTTLVLNTGLATLLTTLGNVGSVAWYQNVGACLVMNMVYDIFCPNLMKLLYGHSQAARKCFDRLFSCGKEKYEDKFDPKKRYSHLMFRVFMTVIFAGGLPILYPIAALFFLVTYWVDKYLLYRATRHPVHYNGEFFISTVKSF
jgi:hypothetical protein